MAGNVVSNVKKYYGGQVPVPGQGDSDGKLKMLVEKTATIEIEGVQTDVELLYDADDLTTPVTPQQLGQWTDENYLIVFKTRSDEGIVRGFVLYALETDSTSTNTLVNGAEFISFKEGMAHEPGASAYEFTMVEDSSTLARYLRDENGEMVVKFNQATVEAGAQSGTLDELIQSDTTAIDFEVVREDGKSYLRLNTEGLSGIFDDMDADIQYIIGALDELPSDEHGYFNSSLVQTPGDGTTENIVIDDFRISQGRDVHGESIEFVPTHQEGGIDFGEVYLNPGTYIFTVHYTLQWVGNPRGTFLPLVTNVGDRPFDFSYEHEDVVRTTRIVTRTTRGKFSLGFPIDADTPQMGIWAKNLEIAQITSYNHAAVAHDMTLTGTGKLDSPLGITPAAFGKVKDIPTSISQFRTGDVIPVDGPNGPAKMGKDDLMQTVNEALAPLSIAKQQIFGYLAPDGITSLNDFTDNIVVEINKTSLTPVTEFPSDYDGEGILICTKTNYSSSNYRVYQKLIHYASRTMYSRRFESSNSAWTAWTSNAIEGKFLKTVEKALWADQPTNLASLDDAPVNTSLVITATSSTTTTNFPTDFIEYPSGTEGVLFTFETLLPTNNTLIEVQLLIRTYDGKMWRRKKIGSWTTWTDGSLSAAGTFAAYADGSRNLSSLNDAEINKIYLVYRTSGTSTTNFPADYGKGNGVLYTQKSVYSSSSYLNVQMLVKLDTGEIWRRQYVSATSTWSSWEKARGNLTASDWFGVYTDLATNLASLDDAIESKTYLIRRTESTATINFPIDFGNGDGVLSTYQGKYTSSWYLKYQILTKYRPNGGVWYREYVSATDTWSAWSRTDASIEITIGPGKMFATLREGIAEAFRHYNSKVIVYPGEYDLVQEFADVLPTISGHNGCLVGKGMHLVFMAGAHVSAMVEKGDYTDEQFNKIKLYFHPFAFYPDSGDLNDDFTVEGLDIRAKHTRYAFHDDYGLSQVPCVHKFINCKMYFENTNTTAQNNFINAIGGGLGRHTTVIVDGGYYECNIAVGSSIIMNGDPDYSQEPIAYHNTTASDEDSESKIILKDVYFADKGYFRATALGGSSVTSKIYISGCRSYFPPLLQKGSSVPSEAPYFNVEVKASWNNEVDQNGHWELDSDDRVATWIPNN